MGLPGGDRDADLDRRGQPRRGRRSENAGAGRGAGAASNAEAATAARLLAEAYGVLRSEAFRENLLALDDAYPAVYARPSAQAASVADIAETVGLKRLFSRFAPAEAAIAEDLGPALGAAGEGAVTGRYADIVIRRAVLRQFEAEDPVVRSCAVNVAAHEYAHTISLTPMGYRAAFTDTRFDEDRIRDRRDRSTPVASYLIGAVAQCTWLAQQGRIGDADVRACVQVFGTAAFNWDRCGEFGGGEPVALRHGLAAPSDPL